MLWYLSFTSLLMTYMAVGAAFNFTQFQLIRNSLTNTQSIIVLVLYPIIIFGAFAQIKILGKTYEFDIINKQIIVGNYFGYRKRSFSFSDFTGIIETYVKSPRGNFKVFYLVKNNEPSFKLSGRVISNLNEIEEVLGQIKYLGFHDYNIRWSLKILFHRLLFE